MYLYLKLMFHFLIFIFRLFGEYGYVGGDVPTPYHKIGAAGDEHVVLAVVDVDHVEDDVFVLGDYHIFFENFLCACFGAFGDGGLDS